MWWLKFKSPLLVFLVCLVLMLLLTVNPFPVQAQTKGLNLDYMITIQKGQPLAHVKLEISEIASTSLKLRFKEEAGYVANYSHNLSATSQGKPLTIKEEGKGIWRVDSVRSSLTWEYDIEKTVPFGYYNPQGKQLSVYISDEACVIIAPYFFIYPDVSDVNSIQIKFNVPAEWKVVTPYIPKGDHFEVQKITQSLLVDFINRQQIYMGKMKFYAERQEGNCTIKFGVLEADQGYMAKRFKTQADVEKELDIIAKSLKTLSNLFGTENPYEVFAMYTHFFPTSDESSDAFQVMIDRYNGNGYPMWGYPFWDQELGHMIYAFMAMADIPGCKTAPLIAKEEIMKGMGEFYYGPILAWRIFKDPLYLGELYYWYTIYERFYQTNWSNDYWFWYLKYPFVALMLDNEIKNATNDTKSLDDVMKYLYATYKNTGHIVDEHSLQAAVKAVTGKDFSELFSRYVYGKEKIPYKYIENYKSYFLNYQGYPTEQIPLYGHTIPFFLNTELLVPQGLEQERVKDAALYTIKENLKNFADYMFAHYNIDNLTEKDVEDALGALTGKDCSGFFTRWEDSYGRLSVEEVKDWLRDYSKKKTNEKIFSVPIIGGAAGVVVIAGVIFCILKIKKRRAMTQRERINNE